VAGGFGSATIEVATSRNSPCVSRGGRAQQAAHEDGEFCRAEPLDPFGDRPIVPSNGDWLLESGNDFLLSYVLQKPNTISAKLERLAEATRLDLPD
jgi:hypothetical protein